MREIVALLIMIAGLLYLSALIGTTPGTAEYLFQLVGMIGIYFMTVMLFFAVFYNSIFRWRIRYDMPSTPSTSDLEEV